MAKPRSRKSRRWPSSNLAQRTQVAPDHKVTLQPIVSISRKTRPLISLPTSLQGCRPRPIRMIRSPSHCCLDIHRHNSIRQTQTDRKPISQALGGRTHDFRSIQRNIEHNTKANTFSSYPPFQADACKRAGKVCRRSIPLQPTSDARMAGLNDEWPEPT